MEEFETSNINFKWLENIYRQLVTIQDLERMAREGCKDMGEFIQIPIHMKDIIIPELRYKNIRYLALELDILINNLIPILKEDVKKYKDRLETIINNIDKRSYFLKDSKINNLPVIEVLPLMSATISLLIKIKSDIIKDIGHLLYIKQEENKRW